VSISQLFDIRGRKAVVTGAGRGIGKVIALALAEAGCDVSILEVNIDDAKVAGEIEKMAKGIGY
jgi:NAD(P)-dependent dehydrogenase (short-subunit alcohol dehydrogenase family)